MFFTDRQKFSAAIAEAEASFAPKQHRERFSVVSPSECLTLEPRLCPHEAALVGGILWHENRTMCGLAFAKELVPRLKERGASLILGDDVVGFRMLDAGSVVVSLRSGVGVPADLVVVCAGVQTGSVLNRFGLACLPPVPLYGMRGHSLTIDVSHMETSGQDNHILRAALCDGDTMTFFSPLPANKENENCRLLRLAAFGDFDGWDHGPEAVRPWRVEQLLQTAAKIFGGRILSESARAATTGPLPTGSSSPSDLCPAQDPITRWCGLRPTSPDSLPLIGRVGAMGNVPLFVNTGHGSLGWTLSAGTAEICASLVAAELNIPTKPGVLCEESLRGVAQDLDPCRFRWREVFRQARERRRVQSHSEIAFRFL